VAGCHHAADRSQDRTVDNVVLVTVDSLRADAVETPGEDNRTPEIGRLAAGGVTFENAFAHGNWTPFSFPGILGSRSVFAESETIGLPDSPTLAEVLNEAGFATGGFNASNGFLTPHWGYDRGFEEFESFIGGDDMNRYQQYLAAHPTINAWVQLAASPVRRFVHWLRDGRRDQPFADTSRMLTTENRASRFIEAATEPFFLWVHYMDTHTPYVPAPQHLREVTDRGIQTHRLLRTHFRAGRGLEVSDQQLADLQALYDGALRQTDASIGRLRETLTEAGVAEETALIVAGDHGEEFMEHGNLSHYPKLYDDLVHVPLIVFLPSGEARTVSEPVGLDSIPPTVAGLLGLDAPSAWDGSSLVPAMSGDQPPNGPVCSVAVRGESITEQPIPRGLADGQLYVSARSAEWVYIENTETGETELYNREDDPTQQRDLTGTDEVPEDVLAELADAVAEHAGGLGGTDDEQPVEQAVSTQLEALGYR
jgi:arylsulfatase A-like enzyme